METKQIHYHVMILILGMDSTVPVTISLSSDDLDGIPAPQVKIELPTSKLLLDVMEADLNTIDFERHFYQMIGSKSKWKKIITEYKKQWNVPFDNYFLLYSEDIIHYLAAAIPDHISSKSCFRDKVLQPYLDKMGTGSVA